MKLSLILFFTLITSNLLAKAPVVKPDSYYECKQKEVTLEDITPELISVSEFILEGVIFSPTELITQNLASKKQKYVVSKLTNIHSLKGNITTDEVLIKHFTRENPYGVCITNLLKTDKEKVVVFLVKPDGFKENFFYFVGHSVNSLGKHQDNKSQFIKETIKEQSKSLKEFNANFDYLKKDVLYEKIKKLIDKSLTSEYQQAAFDEITQIGKPAIPYIVLLMNDYRRLPNSRTMSPGLLHYSPEVVADELSTILSFLTNKHLGRIYNGGSARERKNSIDAWRLYLTLISRNL